VVKKQEKQMPIDELNAIISGVTTTFTSRDEAAITKATNRLFMTAAELKSKEIVVDGIYYKTITEAATAHGITHSAARRRLDGDSDLFSNWQYFNVPPKQRRYMPHPSVLERRPCFINGVEYESVANAAKKLKLMPTTIKNRLCSINPIFKEWYFLDVERKVCFVKKQDMSFLHRSVTVDGVVFKSIKDAADAYGITDGAVVNRIKSKTKSFIKWTYTGDKPKVFVDKVNKRLRAVSINGVIYKSVSDATRAFKMSDASCLTPRLTSRLKEFEHWFYVDEGPKKVIEDNRGKYDGNITPVFDGEIEHASVKVAAMFHGVSTNAILQGIKRNTGKYKDWKLIPRKKKVHE